MAVLKAIISSASARLIGLSLSISLGGRSSNALTVSLGRNPNTSLFDANPVAKLVELFKANYKKGIALV